jgi:hypothetical protein
MTSTEIIADYYERYSEYQEMLGDRFPQFLISKLAADLAKERCKTQYLEKVQHVCARA